MRKTAAGFGLVLILAGAGAFAFNRYQAAQTPTLKLSAVALACKPRQELITPQYRDWLILHAPSADCKENDVQVVYTTGETGVRHYRDDRTLESETIWTYSGAVRKKVKFGSDGRIIVEAMENWLDGTPAWRLNVDDKEVVTVTRYWPNGKVFSEEKSSRRNRESDITFYYATGQKRAHFVGTFTAYNDDLVSAAKDLDIWSESGSPLVHIHSQQGDKDFSTYRADGSLWFVMTKHSMYWMGNPTTVQEYAADGKTVWRQFTLTGGYSPYYIDKIVEFLDDGTTWEYMYKSYSWELSLVRHWDKGKNNILEWKSSDPNFTVDRKMVTEPKFANPAGEWNNMVDRLIYKSSPPKTR